MTQLPANTPQHTPAQRPAAQIVPTVTATNMGAEVVLPAPFAEAALRMWLDNWGAADALIEMAAAGEKRGHWPLPPNTWIIASANRRLQRLLLKPLHTWHEGGRVCWLYPRYTVTIPTATLDGLLAAVEFVKPEEHDAQGAPLPWVPAIPRIDPSLAPAARDDDAVALGATEALPPEPAVTASADRIEYHISDDAIRRWFTTMCITAGIPADTELNITRSRVDQLGFVAGRVWYRVGGPALRVRLTVCPNADLAEVIATIVHELAHPLASAQSGTVGHDRAMKTAFVDLAAKHFGERWFATPRSSLSAPMPVLDGWVTTCIRAALRDGAIPHPRTIDDAGTARLLGRLKKLRELAADQIGQPEGITATATANDLVTLHELGIRGIEIASIDPAQLVDRWVPLDDGSVWRRTLCHGICRYFNVFSLAIPGKGRMHIFGSYADVVAAEYLFAICAARIERECASHITAWKAGIGKTTSAMTRKEKTSFCDSAAITFARKLDAMRVEDADKDAASCDADALERSEEFAFAEHRIRGMGWRGGGSRTFRHNEAGAAVGEAMEVTYGVDGAGPAGRLENR